MTLPASLATRGSLPRGTYDSIALKLGIAFAQRKELFWRAKQLRLQQADARL